jgi:flagellar basal body-associated protein FliL
MIDPITLLSISVLLLSLVVACLAASVPALWWVHLRAAAKADETAKQLEAVTKDLALMDEVVDKIIPSWRNQGGMP